MATFERTWAFDMNRAYSPASAVDLTRYTMWYIAAVLTGNLGGLVSGLWTLYASSDSVTAGTDSTDRWTLAGPYNGAKIVRGASTAVHSWIVLQSPVMNGNAWYLTLSFNSSSDAAIRYWWSKTAPSGGSTTASPTATDRWASTNVNGAADFTINAAATDSSRFSIGLSSGGDFYFVGCKQTAGFSNLGMMFMRCANYHASDAYPVYSWAGYNATSSTANAWYGSTADPLAVQSRYSPPFSGTTAIVNSGLLQYAYCNSSGASSSGALQAIVLTAAHPGGGHSDLPAIHMATHGTSPFVRGRVPDIAIIPNTTTPADGSASPFSAPYDSARVGHLILPANAAFNFA